MPEFDRDLPDHVVMEHVASDTSPLPALYVDEQAAIASRASPSRRRDFTMGRIAARRALARLGIVGFPVLIGTNREPIWPEGIVGSITHASGHALAAVAHRSTTAGIGIDMEHRNRYFAELPSYIAFGKEFEDLTDLDDEARATATLEIFSAKEALYKALFPIVGRFFGFQAACVRRVAGDLEVEVVETLAPDVPKGSRWTVGHVWHDGLVLTTLVLPA